MLKVSSPVCSLVLKMLLSSTNNNSEESSIVSTGEHTGELTLSMNIDSL